LFQKKVPLLSGPFKSGYQKLSVMTFSLTFLLIYHSFLGKCVELITALFVFYNFYIK